MVPKITCNLVIIKIRYYWLDYLEMSWRLLLLNLVRSLLAQSTIIITILLFRLLSHLSLERNKLSVVDALALREHLVEQSYVLLPLMDPNLIQNQRIIS